MHNPYQGKSTTGCDDQLEPFHEWTAVPESSPMPVWCIATFVAAVAVAFVSFIFVMNALVLLLSVIGGG